jgi:uncharacterized protein
MKLRANFIKILFRLFCSYLCISAVLFLLQDLLIFPLLWSKITKSQTILVPPAGIKSFMVNTFDGERLGVWTTFDATANLSSPYVGIIFHGNGETVEQRNYLPFFARHKMAAFTFDYRGYGESTGWPSENKLMQDAESIWQAVKEKTGVSSDKVVILGNSIGSGPASYLAAKINPRALILIAAFSSMPKVVEQVPIYKPFKWLLRYNFPNDQHLKNLKAECLIMAHGRSDEVISFDNLALLKDAAKDAKINSIVALEDQNAMHNDIYYAVESELDLALEGCV